ncbi:MAG: DNA-protecting protein DprA [Myxococcales bacterium]|nr:DNA-protecting protein DprA [Myxococcales bacterium]
MVAAVWTVTPEADGYPARLRALTRPPTLDGVGRLPGPGPAVALVGSRAVRAEAARTAAALAAHAAGHGATVVSGGAIGVDTAAHRGALAAGGVTVVVLGTGIDVVYPDRNHGLFADVIRGGGALLSMFPRGQPPRRGHFVARNAVIAALADVVVVVAAERGSGSLHTARAATRLGRRLVAVPGTAGTDALLAAGAGVIESVADLERALAGTVRARARRALDDDEAALVTALAPGPRGPLELAAILGWRPAAVAAALDELERAGWVRAVGGAYAATR